MVNNKLTLSVNEPTITQISAKQGESGRTLHMSSETVEDGTLKMTLHDGTSVSISAPSGVTGSGSSPLSVDSAVESSVTALDLYGKSTQATYSDVLSALSLAGSTSQSGTPTPSSPIDIVGVGQYDKMVVLDGSETITKYSASSVQTQTSCFMVDIADLYGGTSCAVTDTFKNVYSSVWYSATDGQQFVFSPHTTQKRLYMRWGDANATASDFADYLQDNPVRVWYKSTSYTATSDVYFVTTFTDSNSNFVKSIGTTTASPHLYDGDTFDFVTGTLTRNKNLFEMDTLNWVKGSANKSGDGQIYYVVHSASVKGGYSTDFTYMDMATGMVWEDLSVNTFFQSTAYIVCCVDDSISTVADFKTLISDAYALTSITATTSTLPLSDTFYFRSGEYTFSGDGTLTATYSGTAPSPNYPVSIVSVTNPSVTVNADTYSLTGTLYALPTTNSALANYTGSNNQMWIADVWDVVSGDITRYCGVINSYASESINEPWLSTMDVYSSGTTPTTGATVVYTLSDTTTETGTANTITLAKGTNTLVYADDNSVGDYMKVDGDYGENIATLTELSLSVAGKAYCSLEYSDISTFPFIINVLENHDAN